MRRGTKGSLRLTSIEAFLAVAADETYAKAAANLGLSPTTVMRLVRHLEEWLRKPLIDSEMVCVNCLGDEFIPTALQVMSLIWEEENIRQELSKARVHPDAVLTLGGEPYQTPRALEIASLLSSSRALLPPGFA